MEIETCTPNDSSKKTFLNKETYVPIVSVFVIIGAIFWVASLASQVSSHTLEITKLQVDSESLLDRMARIETKIDLLLERK